MGSSKAAGQSAAMRDFTDPVLDAQLEEEAREFLTETLGIQVTASQCSGLTTPRSKTNQMSWNRQWTCLSCLLTQVYDLFCRAGPDGDT